MKKILFMVLLTGCLHDPYQPPANWQTDDLWCYHRGTDGKWEIQGLARQCPVNTRHAP